MERKAFGREPITNQAALLRCAGNLRSPSPGTSQSHLDRVRSTLPNVATAQLTAADFYDTPKPVHNLKKMAPKLSES